MTERRQIPEQQSHVSRPTKVVLGLLALGASIVGYKAMGGGDLSASPDTPTPIATLVHGNELTQSQVYDVEAESGGKFTPVVEEMAVAQGRKLDPTHPESSIERGITEDSANIAEAVTGNRNGEGLAPGQHFEVAADGPITNQAALHLGQVYEGMKITPKQ